MSGDKIPPIDPVTGKFVRPHDGVQGKQGGY